MARLKALGIWIVVLGLALLLAPLAFALPAGATISSNTTDYGPTRTPSSLTNNRSTITTIVLSGLQQDAHWKAYIGNVTGSLSLQDAANNTIYDWTSITVPTGEIYASRSSSLTFVSPTCANATIIAAEQTAMNMTGSDADNIMKTFNSTNHTSTYVGSSLLSNCNMTSLYVNNASQGKNISADYQEFLMQDATNSLAYVALINDNKVGYNGRTYDFQMLVAESNVQAPSTYYFYVELG